MDITKTEVTKTVAEFIVGAGVGSITKTIIQNNVAPETTYQKVTVTAGSYILGSLVAAHARQHTSKKIDEWIDIWKKASKKIQEESNK